MESFQSILEYIIEFTTLIDIIYTKACIADKYNYCKPKMDLKSKSYVKIKNLRHPLIEKIQTNELYVGNDVQLGINNQDGILLYGTNAVGKTSFIRSIGISVLLAQSGFFVPCEEFIYSPYQYIFTRIIGNDNLFKGLSTFAVEMSELRTILKLSNANSLILGDELCSGTEIASAVGIFVSGIQSLIERKSSFIFATHLHEIISFDEIKQLDTLSLKHMQVVYNKEIDSLVYNRKLMDGPGNNMYGLEVCKSLHLDDTFLENAFNIRSKYAGDRSILTFKKSHFNSKKLIGLCENCKKKNATEVHHLQFQKDANKNGIIKKDNMIFHKNDIANLISLCEECHNSFHSKNCKSKRVKSTKGNSSIEEILNYL
jgi:DNA mismatch repair protein MutS